MSATHWEALAARIGALTETSRSTIFFWAGISAVSALVFVSIFGARVNALLRFVWHCFLRPIPGTDQKTRLDEFYAGQADVYDHTRSRLLRGRHTMLSMSAAHLSMMRSKFPDRRLVWVDIGCGTGWNLEVMHQNYMPISEFDHVYLIDLCEPLLQVAKTRVKRLGLKNVTVLCQDASAFELSEWQDGVLPRGSVGFVTFSYALSMIPSFFTLLDRVEHVLDPECGLIGVVDFYTSSKAGSLHERAIGGERKECSWTSRWFWQIWFDFDKVYLTQRREYLEHRFGTIKAFNGRNKFVLPFVVRIPYYIWLGRFRTSTSATQFRHAFEIDGGNYVGNTSAIEENLAPSLQLGLTQPRKRRVSNAVLSIAPPLSSFHYGVNKPYRLPYYSSPVHKEFRTFIYSFTWEDPEEDMRILNIGKEDTVLCITSAGDNALHYAIAVNPQRLHCVDMNPCQAHLLELKLAAVQCLSYEDYFALFGLGKHDNFRHLLDHQLSPHLSSSAYMFWRINSRAFSTSFYRRGYAGWALRMAQWVFAITRTTDAVHAFCNADTLEQQQDIWSSRIKPVLLNTVVVALLKNPAFCWNALGVPMAQRSMFLQEGTAYEYIRDTFDPLPATALLKSGAYFYLLTLLGHYTPESCPEYLTRAGYEKLRANGAAALDAFRLHTDSIVNVLRGLPENELNFAVVMDHMDWFSPGSMDLEDEVAHLYRSVAPGGKVMFRSAAKYPWYREVFERHGFTVRAAGIRDGPHKAIDRVNMYASCYTCEKAA
ncbi:hypothetical protein BKA62DRAFT_48646 [Auriculariales sp. MPI-PUGE-AT-0066]|nr:hypothetical protein BKA62DRAFT_48646 [Auriculariales sp. MPI-PUGE-AT-0066]